MWQTNTAGLIIVKWKERFSSSTKKKVKSGVQLYVKIITTSTAEIVLGYLPIHPMTEI